jgi:hypothetical protein
MYVKSLAIVGKFQAACLKLHTHTSCTMLENFKTRNFFGQLLIKQEFKTSSIYLYINISFIFIKHNTPPSLTSYSPKNTVINILNPSFIKLNS